MIVFRELEGMLSDRHEDITNLHAQLASSRGRYNTYTACTSAACSLLASPLHTTVHEIHVSQQEMGLSSAPSIVNS